MDIALARKPVVECRKPADIVAAAARRRPADTVAAVDRRRLVDIAVVVADHMGAVVAHTDLGQRKKESVAPEVSALATL